jgi:ribosome recycling factor
MVNDVLRELEKKMKGSVEHFRGDLTKLRTGRANINIFEGLKIDYYGALTPINQVATTKQSTPQTSVSIPSMTGKSSKFPFPRWMKKDERT